MTFDGFRENRVECRRARVEGYNIYVNGIQYCVCV